MATIYQVSSLNERTKGVHDVSRIKKIFRRQLPKINQVVEVKFNEIGKIFTHESLDASNCDSGNFEHVIDHYPSGVVPIIEDLDKKFFRSIIGFHEIKKVFTHESLDKSNSDFDNFEHTAENNQQ